MNTTARIDQPAGRGLRARVGNVLWSEVGLARIAIGLVALHVVDDRFVQPNPGTSASDHLVGERAAALLVAGGVFYGRVRAGLRATIALAAGFFGVLAGIEAAYYAKEAGPSGDDYTGLLSLLAGLLLLGFGAVTLWRSSRTNDPLWWRYGRRALIPRRRRRRRAGGHAPDGALVRDHPRRPRARPGGEPRRTLRAGGGCTTSDGLRLRGWYIPSRNGAAVISFPGRAWAARRPARRCSPAMATACCSSTAAVRARARATRTCLAGRESATSTRPSPSCSDGTRSTPSGSAASASRSAAR